MTGDDIEDFTRTLLQDPDSIHWDGVAFLVALNSSLQQVVTDKPKAGSGTENITITANSTRQELPEGVIQVLGLNCNIRTDGTFGRAITTTTAERMTAASINWRRDRGTAVKHLVVDDRDPGAFNIWPGLATEADVEALVVRMPSEVTDMSAALPLGEEYKNALAHHTLHVLYAMDGEHTLSPELSAAHYAKYAQIMGIQIKQQKRASAPTNSPENPAYPAVDKNGA
jgi:hypothetical protein